MMTDEPTFLGYMSLPSAFQLEVEDHLVRRSVDTCEICGDPVIIQIFKGTHLCCIVCQKVKAGELSREDAHQFKPNIPLEVA